jgi:large subunit ribosomal protein L25
MKSIEIKASLRKELGKKESNDLRKQDKIPCVMYGGKDNIHFSAIAKDFRHIIYTHDVYLVNLDIDGTKYQALLKDLQFHPVTDAVIHLDFVQVFEDKPVVIELPVTISGTSEGILAGGKLRQRRRYLKTKGLVKDFPDYLNIDITPLNIGDFVKVGDLKFENLELLDPARSMVVGVASSRVAKGMELVEVTPEGATPAAEGAAAEGTAEGAAEAAPKESKGSKE